MPLPVQQAEQFLTRLGRWFKLSRNHDARSCRDAAHKRNRLGHEGIPLWDEMKSFFGRYANAVGETRLVVAHCRADQRLHFGKLSAVLGVERPPERLTEQEIEQLGLEYGMVNPWETWRCDPRSTPFTMDVKFIAQDVVQVFDDDLLQPIGTPGTVMTNAGDLTWAVEFHPRELVAKLAHAKVADIAEPDPEEEPRLWGVKDDRPIGIITGNPPEAGMYCQVRGIPYTLTWGLIPEGSIFTGWEALDFREACSLSHGLGSISGSSSMPRCAPPSATAAAAMS